MLWNQWFHCLISSYKETCSFQATKSIFLFKFPTMICSWVILPIKLVEWKSVFLFKFPTMICLWVILPLKLVEWKSVFLFKFPTMICLWVILPLKLVEWKSVFLFKFPTMICLWVILPCQVGWMKEIKRRGHRLSTLSPGFESAGCGGGALRQGTVSSLPSPSEGTF